MEDIPILLHFLSDTPGRRIALSHINPPIPSAEAKKIWESWSSHLAHEETPDPHGSLSRDFFANIMTISHTNAGE
jgi:hypothetical protein